MTQEIAVFKEPEQQYKFVRLSYEDALRIKNEKIKEAAFSRIVLSPWGRLALRRQNKHSYFSAKA